MTPPGESAPATRARLAQPLLAPRSVAIVGQSNDPAKTAGRPLKFLRQAGYAGRIYPVNARRDTVLGERAWPSLAALPEVPEHVYIVTADRGRGRGGAGMRPARRQGRDRAGRRLRRGRRRGRGARGAAARGRATDRPAHRRPIEPRRGRTCASSVMLTANAAFDEQAAAGRPHLRGLPQRRHDRRAAVARARRAASALPAWSRSATRSIFRSARFAPRRSMIPASTATCCSSRSLRHADTLRAFALAAAARGKPILAYKLGRSAAARELAVSHTGALAGEDDVARRVPGRLRHRPGRNARGADRGPAAAGARAGAHRDARPPRVGVVTTTAGGATMVVDPLAVRGVDDRAAERRHAGAPRRRRHRGQAGAADRSHARRHPLREHEGGARHPCDRAGIRSGAGRGRLLGAVSSGARGQADHRLRRRGQADRGLPGAGRAGRRWPR